MLCCSLGWSVPGDWGASAKNWSRVWNNHGGDWELTALSVSVSLFFLSPSLHPPHIVVKNTQHKIYHVSLFKCTVMLRICTLLYNSLWNCFILYNRNLISPKQLSFLPSHSPPVTTILFAVAKSLILFCFLWLAYFTKHTVLKVHPCCSICQNFILFSGWVVFPCRYRSHLKKFFFNLF